MRVAILGAGVLGASTAFHLVQAGAEVVVADQAHAGRATAAGAGIISPRSSAASIPIGAALPMPARATTPL